MKKILIIILTLIVILIVGAFIFFVSGVSAVSDPIKKYEYSGNIDQLLSGVRKLTLRNPNVGFKITDTTGGYSNTAIYLTINIKNDNKDIEYGWKCEKNNNDTKSTTIISLVEAYDITNNSGGYIAEGKGVQPLVKVFESILLVPLKKEEHVVLKPL